MSTSSDDNKPEFEIVDAPVTPETAPEDDSTTYIAHRKPDGTETRMPMRDWPEYAKENNL